VGKSLEHQALENRVIVFQLYRGAHGNRVLKYTESLGREASLVIVSQEVVSKRTRRFRKHIRAILWNHRPFTAVRMSNPAFSISTILTQLKILTLSVCLFRLCLVHKIRSQPNMSGSYSTLDRKHCEC
jgi:hypothetical protein